MKNNVRKLLAIIAAAVVMAFGFTGCDDEYISEQTHSKTSQDHSSKPIIFGTEPDPEESVPFIEETPSYAFSYHYDSDYDGMVIDNYFLESPKVRIPDTLEGEPVTRVDMQLSKKNFTYLILPETVKSISLSAETKKGLEYINVPRDMTCVDGYSSCHRLESIVIPDGATEIGYYAFSDCTSLTSVTIPDSVTEISVCAFNDCTSLTSITLPDSVTYIGKYAFAGCENLTSITIPDSVTEIDLGVFLGCTSLTSITIPDSVTEIGEAAFSGTGLTSVTIPDSVTSIGWKAFMSCTSLTSVTISDSVTKIDLGVFLDCTSLTSVTIPDSVTEIFDGAFRNCSSLTNATYKGKTYDYEHIYDLYHAINSN